MFWDILFYGIIIVGAILMISLTAYRIDWARHPAVSYTHLTLPTIYSV